MKLSSFIILALLLSACSQKPASVKKYYRLSEIQTRENDQLTEGNLWIKRPEAHSILGNRPMVATDENGALQQLAHHAWIESPKVLIQELLVIHAQNYWQTAIPERPKGMPYHRLHTRITAFEKNDNLARISMQFTLYDPDGLLIKKQTLSASQDITGPTYADFAHAMGQAFTQLLTQLELKP